MPETDPNKTVFISYRRSVSSFHARAIFERLKRSRYDVFMDVESLDSGTFDTVILNQIAARTHFLVVLTPGTLERCAEPNDWLRREIELALDTERNLVPIAIEGFSFKDAEKYLTGKLSELARYHAITISHEYFNEGIDRLKKRFLKKFGSTPTITPTPVNEISAVAEKIAAAERQPEPTQPELSAESLFFQSIKRLQQDDIESVLTDIEKALTLNPNYVIAYYIRAMAYFKIHDEVKATADFAKAFELGPDFVLAISNLYATLVRDVYPPEELSQANEALAVLYLSRGSELIQSNLPKAMTNFDKALELNPSFVEAYFNRGLAWGQQGDVVEAIADYDKALELNPSFAEAYFNRGLARHQQGDVAEAIADYNKAIELKPHYAHVYFLRGVLRYKRGDVVGAITDFDKAIDLYPDDSIAYSIRAEVYSNRAEAYLVLKQYEKALANFNRANELRPEYPMIIGGMAITHHAMGKVDEGKRLWEELLKQDGRYRDVEWVRQELNWAEALVEEARKLIAGL